MSDLCVSAPSSAALYVCDDFSLLSCKLTKREKPGMGAFSPHEINVRLGENLEMTRRIGLPTAEGVLPWNATHVAIVTLDKDRCAQGFGLDAAEAVWYALNDALAETLLHRPVPRPQTVPEDDEGVVAFMAEHFARKLAHRRAQRQLVTAAAE